MDRLKQGCKLEKYYCWEYGITEYSCGYNTTIDCEQCMYVVAIESGDKRQGRDPAAKCNQEPE